MDFDPTRAWLKQPDYFRRFKVPAAGEPLAALGVPGDELVAIVRRGDRQRALILRQLVYHHVAEGELGGEPFAVTF